MIKKISVGLVLVAAIVAAVLYFNSSKPIPTVVVKQTSIVEAVYGIGTVVTDQTFVLKVGVPTTVRGLNIQEGSVVQKGQKLVTLEGLPDFIAPFSGIVTSLPVRVGESVFAQTPILKLSNFQNRYLTVSLEQAGVIRVTKGLKASVTFENLPEQRFEGKVESVYANDDRFLVRIEVSKLPTVVMPGMTADVSITIATRENVVIIPISAIKDGVVSVKGKSCSDTREVGVTTGIVDSQMAEITSHNLHAGDVLCSF